MGKIKYLFFFRFVGSWVIISKIIAVFPWAFKAGTTPESLAPAAATGARMSQLVIGVIAPTIFPIYLKTFTFGSLG